MATIAWGFAACVMFGLNIIPERQHRSKYFSSLVPSSRLSPGGAGLDIVAGIGSTHSTGSFNILEYTITVL